MARQMFTVKSPKSGQASAVEVPQDVKDEIDEVFAHLRQFPDEEGFVRFDSTEERKAWEAQVRTYAATREAGALKFRRLPSKHLPETELRFKLTVDMPANGERKAKKN